MVAVIKISYDLSAVFLAEYDQVTCFADPVWALANDDNSNSMMDKKERMING